MHAFWGCWVWFKGSFWVEGGVLPVVPSAVLALGKASRVVGQNVESRTWDAVCCCLVCF